ncbi:hypothetical protein, partial [Schlesneria sp.]|uniref:hypothetical protein n=1 Tax=Schlesneria sp. TaxID=2762018 RepID=UPI002F02B828
QWYECFYFSPAILLELTSKNTIAERHRTIVHLACHLRHSVGNLGGVRHDYDFRRLPSDNLEVRWSGHPETQIASPENPDVPLDVWICNARRGREIRHAWLVLT